MNEYSTSRFEIIWGPFTYSEEIRSEGNGSENKSICITFRGRIMMAYYWR